jgi:hypothetical protein
MESEPSVYLFCQMLIQSQNVELFWGWSIRAVKKIIQTNSYTIHKYTSIFFALNSIIKLFFI